MDRRYKSLRTRAELDKILIDHARWLDSEGREGSRADLRGTDLRDADLGRAYLSRANLSGANLSGAYLLGAGLIDVDLHEAILVAANLLGAHLSGAILIRANLSGAILSRTDLSGVVLTDADLSGARLGGANLNGSFFEPSTLPSVETAAYAQNLSRVLYRSNPKALVELRNAFKELNLGKADREITAALRRHNPQLWETVLFDWTCEFGANAFRPLLFIFCLWGICALFYYSALRSRGKAGLYLLASGKRVSTGAEKLRVRRLRYSPLSGGKGRARLVRWLRREEHAWSTAAFFSLMSTFNLGFREFNFGRWIRMVQPREFDIKAHGWVRVVSGTQSLLSVGLLALSLLSYFGRPFEG